MGPTDRSLDAEGAADALLWWAAAGVGFAVGEKPTDLFAAPPAAPDRQQERPATAPSAPPASAGRPAFRSARQESPGPGAGCWARPPRWRRSNSPRRRSTCRG